MTSQEAIERALRLITPAPNVDERVAWQTTLGVLINDARTELADQIASANDRQQRELLRKTFANVVSDGSGIASLSVPLADAEPLYLKHFNSAEIYLSGVTRRLTLLPDESSVKLDRMAGFPFGTLIGSNLLVWNGGAPFVGNVSIRGPFIPTLANLKTEMEEPYVLVLHSMASKQIPSPQRTQAREAKAVLAEGK